MDFRADNAAPAAEKEWAVMVDPASVRGFVLWAELMNWLLKP